MNWNSWNCFVQLNWYKIETFNGFLFSILKLCWTIFIWVIVKPVGKPNWYGCGCCLFLALTYCVWLITLSIWVDGIFHVCFLNLPIWTRNSVKLHVDCCPIEIDSYLCEEWKERQKEKWEEGLSSKFLNMRFVPLAVMPLIFYLHLRKSNNLANFCTFRSFTKL